MKLAKKITTAAALAAALLAGTAPKAAAQCPYTVGPLGRYIAPAIVQGNGDVVAINPAPVQGIDLHRLAYDLKSCQWSQTEVDIITRTLAACGLDC